MLLSQQDIPDILLPRFSKMDGEWLDNLLMYTVHLFGFLYGEYFPVLISTILLL